MPPPELRQIAAARADLGAHEVERQALDVRAATLAAQRQELLAHGASGAQVQPIETELRDVAGRRESVDRLRDDITGRIRDLSDRIVATLGTPEDAVATLDGATPVALLPVRVETRFADNATKLRVRVFPDQIHIDNHDPALTAEEITAGTNYWTMRWPNLDDTLLADGAWKAMCAGFRPGRARFVVDRMRPTNQPHDGDPAFPDVERRAAGWSRAATATALPDRIVVAGYRRVAEGQYAELFRVWGEGVPDRLQVGPSPEPKPPAQPGGLPNDEGMAWLHDPELARGSGMLITITDANLTGGRRLAQGVDRLLVLGVDWTLPPADAAHAVEGLLAAQRDEGQLAFVPQGTPTNNTSATRSGWSSDKATLAGLLDPAAPPPTLDGWSAGRRLAAALGLDPATFDLAPGADLREQRVQSALADALWRVTGGYYLVDMLDPLAKDNPAIDADLREHVAAHLFAGGPLPAVRIGPQPYGVLPVVARRRFQADRTSRAETTILRVASVLRELVEPLVEGVPHFRRAGDPQAVEKTLLALLLRTPVPWTFDFRHAVGPVQRKAMSVYWDEVAAFQTSWTAMVWSRLQTYQLTRLSEMTLDPDGHPLDVPLVRKSGADGNVTRYLGEIKALLSDPNGELALRLRQDSEALLEALVACAAAREMTRVQGRKVRDELQQFHPEMLATLEIAKTLDVTTPESFRIESPVASAPLVFASSRELSAAVVPEIHPTATLGELAASDFAKALPDLGRIIGAPTDPLYWMARFSTAIDDLAAAPPDELEWAFRGHLDLFSTRMDAWWTSLAHRRLEAHRASRPTGVHVGCWSWLEDLHPDPAGTDSLGYVHTPSLDHAATAALLRSGRQAHQNDDGAIFDIEITSARTREALSLLRGVAQGQRIAALLGYRLERRLQQAGPEFAQYIWHLRNLAPMRSDEAALDAPTEVIAARDVVDALTLLDRWKRDRTGVLTDAKVAAGHQNGVSAVLDAVAALYDGVADVLVAEAVHQAAQGNLERSGAALAAQDRQSAAPDLEFVKTPRPGHTMAQRVGLLLQETSPQNGWPADARSLAEPRLDAWVGRVLGGPETFEVAARLVRGETTEDLDPIAVSDLGFGALSLVLASQRPAEGRPSGLEARLALAVASQVAQPGPEDRIELLADGPASNPERGLGLLLAVAGSIAKVLSSPALTGPELRGSDEMARAGGSAEPAARPDVAELTARATAVVGALGDVIDDASDGLASAITSADSDRLASALALADAFDTDATPLVPAGHPDAADRLGAQAQEVLDRLVALRTAATAALAAAPDPDAVVEVARLIAIVRSVVGAAQPVLPTITLSDPAAVQASLDGATALSAGDPLAAVGWLHKLALVRPALDPLASALLHAEADGADLVDELRIVQAPHRPGAPWCALPFGEAGPPPNGTAAFVAHVPGPLDVTNPLAGILVDSWTETVPASVETTAVTFHYDAPGARAPQSVVLAVHPATNPRTWDLPTLLDTVHEAADLARLRTLTAAELAPLGGFLPALYLPDDYTRDVPSVPLKDLLVKASLIAGGDSAYKTVLGKG